MGNHQHIALAMAFLDFIQYRQSAPGDINAALPARGRIPPGISQPAQIVVGKLLPRLRERSTLPFPEIQFTQAVA